MKVLVIGGCGFIGSHVVDSLLAEGISVRVFDRRTEAYRDPLPNVEYVLGDFADTPVLFEALDQIDAVIHLASTTVPATANLDPVADIEGNLISTVRFLETLRSTGISKLIYLSSGGTVYGIPSIDPIPETHPLRPINSYGIVKVAIENYLFMEHRLHGLQVMVLRPSNPYGPRQGHTGIQGVIGTHFWRIANNEPIEVWGDGSIIRDFIHVRDMARCCVAAITSSISGCFNVGSGRGTSIRQIVDGIGKTVALDIGRKIKPVYQPGRSFDVPRVVLDISEARRKLGWAPKISLEDGLRETWKWIRSQNLA